MTFHSTPHRCSRACAVLSIAWSTAALLGCGSTANNPGEKAGSGGSAGSANATQGSGGSAASPASTSGTGTTGSGAANGVSGSVSGAGGTSGSAAATTSAGGGGGASVTGGTPGTSHADAACESGTPWTEEADVGTFACQDDLVWRQEAVECPRGTTRSEATDLPSGVGPELLTRDDCAHDDDCGEEQVCRLGINYEDPCMGGDPEAITSVYRVCEQHCQSDADCGEGLLCLCDASGDGLNNCVPTLSPGVDGACWSDQDCGGGLRCLGTAWGGFVCQHPLDECAINADCGEGMYCASLFDQESEAYLRRCFEDLGSCVLG